MSNKISLDIEANTTNAEKAIVDLTRDVDKLQRKAAQTNVGGSGGGRRSSSRSSSRAEAHKEAQSAQQMRRASVDLSGLKSAFAGVSDSINNLTGGLINAVGQLNTFTDVLTNLYFTAKGFNFAGGIIKGAGGGRFRTRTAPIDKFINRARSSGLTVKRRDPVTGEKVEEPLPSDVMAAAVDMLKEARRYTKRQDVVRYSRARYRSTYGPWRKDAFGELTPEQQINRGRLQLAKGGVIPARRYMPSYRVPGGIMSGLGNMLLGSTNMGLRSLGMAPITGYGLGTAALYGATGAVAGAAAAPYLYSSSQVEKGRQKADELSDLQAQFNQLSKNINGISIDTLSKDLQRLGVEGVVPVEQLTRGASMLMLAFKGNQQEVSKWTNILADMSAGTGQSIEYFAELITKANQFGTVEFEVFNQLNEKGIPIIEQLKGKFGETREEIMKAAQAGRITAEEFMRAFEAAHKASMEGANAARAEASRMSVAKQTEQYEEIEASNFTRGYDNALMDYERQRRDRARRRSEDVYVAAQAEAMGDALGDLVEALRWAANGIKDSLVWVAEAIGAWKIDEHALEWLTEMDVQTARARTRIDIDGDEMSSSTISSLIEQQSAIVVRAQKIQNEDEFDDETRQHARKTALAAERQIRRLEALQPQVLEREENERIDAELQRNREERAANQRRTREKWAEEQANHANTEEELLRVAGVYDFAALEARIESYRKALDDGTAVDSDLEKYKFYDDIRNEILDIRKEIERQTEQAQEEAEREAQRERERENKRRNYLAKRHIEENPDDYEAAYDYKYQQRAQEMHNLGFSRDEIDGYLTETRARDIVSVENKMAENDKKIAQEEEAIANSKKTGQEAVLNAWGSATRTMATFTSPYEQNSLKELRQINTNLQKEIDALNRLDPTSRAQ